MSAPPAPRSDVTGAVAEPAVTVDAAGRPMRRRLLIVAYHFPPIQESSGVLRTLAFAKYLPENGWDVTVLTAHPRAYGLARDENLAMIPAGTRVVRAFALDAQRHCSIKGRYPSWLAVPDRWQTWIAGATLAGRKVIRDWRPDVIYSTFPIASAHVIGLLLHRWSGLPWVADFRDPMTGVPPPPSAVAQRSYAWVERQVFTHATAVTVTTPGTREMYERAYPGPNAPGITAIGNGFDEELPGLATVTAPPPPSGRKVRLLHSGLIYAEQRNPEFFLQAIGELKRAGRISAGRLEIVLRASGNEQDYERRIAQLDVGDIVTLAPAIGYGEAMQEMGSVDGLVILQGANCSRQVPAKLYEYLYAGRPILGITNRDGDTGRLLREFGFDAIAALEDVEAIKDVLPRFVDDLSSGSVRVPSREAVMRLSRRERTVELAQLLDRLVPR